MNNTYIKKTNIKYIYIYLTLNIPVKIIKNN